jgi:hypothetical protein
MTQAHPFTESVVEEAALEWFGALGYQVVFGPTIAPGEPAAERSSYEQILLEARLRETLRRLNLSVPPEAIDEAFRKLTRISSPQLVDANHELHYYLLNGVSVEYLRGGRHDRLRPGPRDRLRRPRPERLACCRPVHCRRRRPHPAARRCRLRQRPTARGD